MSDLKTWITACNLDDIEQEGATRFDHNGRSYACLLYTSPSPRD